jgi:membrane fusion protein
VLTAFVVVAATSIILFLLFGSYTRRTPVAGQLVPVEGLATVTTPASGVLSRILVEEGQRVEAGQLLAVLNVPRATPTTGDTVAALEAQLRRRRAGLDQARQAQDALLDAQARGLSRQLDAAQHQLRQLQSEIATRGEQVRIARESLERLRELQRNRYVGELQVKQQESALLEHRAVMQALQRQAAETRRLQAQLQQALRELPAQRQLAVSTYRRDRALLDQEQVETEARGELAIVAPVAGVVATRVLKAGQSVQAGQSVMSLIAGDGRLEAELLVPSRAIGFIEPGDRVLLRYQAFPYQKSATTPGASPASAAAR